MPELQLSAKKCDFFDEIRNDGHHFMRYRFVIEVASAYAAYQYAGVVVRDVLAVFRMGHVHVAR